MSTPNKNGFLVLSSSTEWYKKLSHAEIQTLVDENQAWVQNLIAQGKVKGGNALLRQGASVSGPAGRIVVDGPYPESKEAIGGYIHLDVATLEEAVAIVQSIPSLRYNTTMHIRPVGDECPVTACARELAQKEELVNS
jgi:hypothetical protein